MPRIIGPVIEIEQVRGYYDAAANTTSDPFQRLHVLDGIEVAHINAKVFEGRLPSVGDVADLDVRVIAYSGRGDVPTLSYSLRRVLDPVTV